MMKFELFFGRNIFKKQKQIISNFYFRFQYRCIQHKDITDERLPIMCIALWKKMKYAIKKDKKQNF